VGVRVRHQVTQARISTACSDAAPSGMAAADDNFNRSSVPPFSTNFSATLHCHPSVPPFSTTRQYPVAALSVSGSLPVSLCLVRVYVCVRVCVQ
jgi:hypothetical protein